MADNPPFVLDVDSGRVTPVTGVPVLSRGTLEVVGVGGRAAVVVARSTYRRADLYAVRSRGARVSSLGKGWVVLPAAGGRSVWVKSSVSPARCALRLVGLDGHSIRAGRAFPCATTIYPGGPLGLVVNRTRVIDPRTGRTVLGTRLGIVAVAGQKLLLEEGPAKGLVLLNAATGVQLQLRWPSILGGLHGPAVDPRGRFVALAFGNPSWTSAAGQAFDVWLLDTETGKLTQLPGMPTFVALKMTSMAWTPDGRLVLLAQDRGGRDVVAVWRPGQERLALKTVRLPVRSDSGSDSFALLR